MEGIICPSNPACSELHREAAERTCHALILLKVALQTSIVASVLELVEATSPVKGNIGEHCKAILYVLEEARLHLLDKPILVVLKAPCLFSRLPSPLLHWLGEHRDAG